MTIESWLQATIADADTRGLPELRPLLEGLAKATRILRSADFNNTAAGHRITAGRQVGLRPPEGHQR